MGVDCAIICSNNTLYVYNEKEVLISTKGVYMSLDGVQKFLGFGNSAKNQEYQQMLDEKVNSVFGDKKLISKADLFVKDEAIYNAYKQLDEKGRKNFDAILSLHDDKETVSASEYKTLLTVLDAEQVNPDPNSPRLMDGRFDVAGPDNGIYSLDVEDDVRPLHDQLKFQSMTKEEVLDDLVAEINKQIYSSVETDKYGSYGLPSLLEGQDMLKIMETITRYVSESDNKISLEEGLKAYFGDAIENITTDYDKYPSYAPFKGNSYNRYLLNNYMGEQVVIDEDFGYGYQGVSGKMEVWYPDGTREEYKKPRPKSY